MWSVARRQRSSSCIHGRRREVALLRAPVILFTPFPGSDVPSDEEKGSFSPPLLQNIPSGRPSQAVSFDEEGMMNTKKWLSVTGQSWREKKIRRMGTSLFSVLSRSAVSGFGEESLALSGRRAIRDGLWNSRSPNHQELTIREAHSSHP